MFSIRFLPEKARMVFTCEGLWSASEADAFCAELRTQMTAARCAGRPIRMLAVLDGYQLPCPSAAEATDRAVDLLQSRLIERYALVTQSALVRLRIRRLLDGVNYQIFNTREEAAAWLEWPMRDVERALAACGATPPPPPPPINMPVRPISVPLQAHL